MIRVIFSVMLAVAMPATQEPTAGPATVAELEVPADWARKLDALAEDLARGDIPAAERGARRLAKRAVKRVAFENELQNVIGLALLLEARALFAKGEQDLAMWTWQIAQLMTPELRSVALGEFGDAGRFLDGDPRVGDPAYHREWQGKPLESYGGDGELTEPETISRGRPGLSGGTGKGSFVEVGAIIDLEGNVRRPYLITFTGRPEQVLEGLNALWDWRFEPARRGGEPVPLLFRLSLSMP